MTYYALEDVSLKSVEEAQNKQNFKQEDFKTLEIPLVGETADVGKRSVQKKKIA